MNIAIISDLHYPVFTRSLEELDSHPWREADVLVLAGDLVNNFNEDHLNEVLKYFSSFPGEKLFVAGNHELWDSMVYETADIYRDKIRLLTDEYRFFYLDHSPYEVSNVCFVGNIGWYDYSFAPKSFPLPDGLIILEEDNPENQYSFKETNKRWEDLGPDDFQRKRLAWKVNGKLCLAAWNDRTFVRWGLRDEEFLGRCLERLRQDLEEVSRKIDQIVVVTHHLPFPELVEKPDTIERAFGNAFMGSRKMGEVIREFPRVKMVICGHSHREQRIRIGNIDVLNARSFCRVEI
jgi:predicted phosphohydrolase